MPPPSRGTETFTHDVFLSHSAKDKAVVRPLAGRLRQDGRRNDSQPSTINHQPFGGSDWAQLEAGTFRFRDPLNKERRFIPLRLDDAPIKGSLAQFLCIKWLPADREQEHPKALRVGRHHKCKTESSERDLIESRKEKVLT
jgi:hypothetical protein